MKQNGSAFIYTTLTQRRKGFTIDVSAFKVTSKISKSLTPNNSEIKCLKDELKKNKNSSTKFFYYIKQSILREIVLCSTIQAQLT